MKYLIILLLTLYLQPLTTIAQYSMSWNKTYGENEWDEANCIIETYDKGLIMAGFTKIAEENRYMRIIKTDQNGNKIWDKTFKEYYSSTASQIIETKNHDLAIAGSCIKDGEYFSNFWILRLDEFGNLKWQKTFGESGDDIAKSIVETYDGGLALAGSTDTVIYNSVDVWAIKLDAEGNRLWDKTFGKSEVDYANSICETSDKCLVLAGFTGEGDVDRHSDRSIFIIKLDENGNQLWENMYGESVWDIATSVIETSDKFLAVAGYTKGEGLINYDILVLKLDLEGNKIWSKIIGKENWDEGTSIIETYDKGLAIAGYTRSKDDAFSHFQVVKLDKEGKETWNHIFIRGSLDFANSIAETWDKGLAVAGYTNQNNDKGWQFAILKYVSEQSPRIHYRQPSVKESITIQPLYEMFASINSKSRVDKIQLILNDTIQLEMSKKLRPDIAEQINDSTILLKHKFRLKKGFNRFKISANNYGGTSYSEERTVNYIILPRIFW